MMETATAVQRPAILVVDDDDDIREALAELLEDRGYAVTTAVDGEHALRLLRGGGVLPSLVLLDLMMPVLDGYGFLDEQRKDERLRELPVAIITASHGVDRDRIGDVVPVLRKPISLPVLLAAVERLRQGPPHEPAR